MASLRFIVLGCIVLSAMLANCGYVDDTEFVAEYREINYRGETKMAKWDGEFLTIEGDIVVLPSDIYEEDDNTSDGYGIRRQNLNSISGLTKKWPNGNVCYLVDSSMDGPDPENPEHWREIRVIAAVLDIEGFVPGITFTRHYGNDAPPHCPNYIRFKSHTTDCNSPLGMVGGEQIINLADGCLEDIENGTRRNRTVHHEIMHSLGADHEHCRKGRDQKVVVECLLDPTCEREDESSSNLFDYDFDSIMHYGLWNHGWVELSLQDGVEVPPGIYVGQISHLSQHDILGLRAMYPVIKNSNVVFGDTGIVCPVYLSGREEDIANTCGCQDGAASWWPLPTSPIDTSAYIEGDYEISCLITSALWSGNYNYPNYSTPANPSWPLEYFGDSFTMRVLNPGLIPVLFSAHLL